MLSHTKRSLSEVLARNYGLLTAEILYGMPDYPSVLQTFVLQEYDVAPNFPRLLAFMHFWVRTLDAPLHSVRFEHEKLIHPRELRLVDGKLVLH